MQRILLHASIYARVKERLVAETKKLKVGDPKDEEVSIGPMISESEAARLESWLRAAVDAGAKVLCGGRRTGTLFPATLVENVPKDQQLRTDEAFGPVALLSRFDDFEQALREVNDSAFGLQAGVFTRDIYRAHRAGFGMIRWKQEAMGFPEYGLRFGNPDFLTYARAYGATGVRIERTTDLEPLLERCLGAGGVHLLEVPVDYGENRLFTWELSAMQHGTEE